MNTPRLFARAVIAVAAGIAGLTPASPAGACPPGDGDQEYHIVASATTAVGHHLTRTASIVQFGDDPVNRFEMVRVAPRHRSHRGSLLLLPPVSSGFANYETGDEGDYSRSFAGFFAERGYEVWGLSQRTQLLVAGDCESGAVDCSAMAGWGLQTLLDDASWVRTRILAAHPGEDPVVGGVSLGSIASIALLDQHPHHYAGAILLEGTPYDEDPAVRAVTQVFCDTFTGALAAGVYYDDQQLPGMRMLAHLATVDPAGPSPVPPFAGLSNHRAFVASMSAPGIGPITPRPGYAMLRGDPAEDAFFYGDDALARANMSSFVDYMALATVRDVDCSLAGDRTFTSHLERFHGPVFVNAGGHGFGPGMLDTLTLMSHAEPTVNYVEEYGHMDHFLNVDHRLVNEQPILDWLRHEVFHHHH